MSLQLFFHDLYEFLHFVCVYFATILGFCALMSVIVIGIIMLLRSTLLSKSIFGKAALWALMIPCLFCGKLHFYYESRIGVKFFYWWYALIGKWQIICVIYWFGAILVASWLGYRRIKLHRIVSVMEGGQNYSCKSSVKVFPGQISSFCTGILKPIIVIPKDLPKEQSQIIIEHEETHIRLGHLWMGLLWEVLRVLLWPNLLLHICEKHLKRDLEEVCDAVTIQRNEIDTTCYAEILVSNARRIAAAQGGYGAEGGMSFAWGDNYTALKKRLEKIIDHVDYNSKVVIAGALILVIGVVSAITVVKSVSYKRTNDMGMLSSVCYVDEEGKIKALDVDYDNDIVKDFDDEFISIDGNALMEKYPEALTGNEYFYFSVGGYYKIPGIGGGGGWGEINSEDVHEGIIKINNHTDIDIWNRIIMWL